MGRFRFSGRPLPLRSHIAAFGESGRPEPSIGSLSRSQMLDAVSGKNTAPLSMDETVEKLGEPIPTS